MGSDDVIQGHQQVFANNSRLKRGTDVGVISLCLPCQDASTDNGFLEIRDGLGSILVNFRIQMATKERSRVGLNQESEPATR